MANIAGVIDNIPRNVFKWLESPGNFMKSTTLSKTKILTLVVLVGASWSYFYLPGVFGVLGRDTFIFIDGIYRTLSGQVPNVDFSSQLGPALWVIPASILSSNNDIWLGVPVFLSFSAFLALLIASFALPDETLLEKILFVLISSFVVLLIISPARFGDGLGAIVTWHRIYSDVCNAILIIIVAWTFLKLADRVGPIDWPLAIVFSFGLLYLLFLKVTYFIAASIVLSVPLLFSKLSWRSEILRFAGVLLLGFSVIMVLEPRLVYGYFSDLAYSAAMSSSTSNLFVESTRSAYRYAPFLALILAVVGVIAFSRSGNSRIPTVHIVLFLVSIVAGVGVNIFIDYYDNGPVKSAIVYGVLFGLGYLATHLRSSWWRNIWVVALFFLVSFQDTAANTLVLYKNYRLLADNERPVINNIGINHGAGDFTEYIETGRRFFDWLGHRSPYSACAGEARHFVSDIADPFGALLERPASHTMSLWIHDGVTVSSQNPPSLSTLIGEASFVMVPKSPMWASATAFVTNSYKKEIQRMNLIYENEGWRIYLYEPNLICSGLDSN